MSAVTEPDQEIIWTPQQSEALLAVAAWLKNKKGPQVFRLFGFAGTGKTTLAKEINKMVKGLALFMCYTGKASLVLQRKGCVGASTIHAAIYKAIEDKTTGLFTFKLDKDSAVVDAPLVIVDEVSMVGEELGRDLLSFGTRILVLGDPEQLPPISGEGFFTSQEPDYMLTDIRRQALDNPIIRMSMDVREGRRLRLGDYGSSRVIRANQVVREEVLAADQILVGRNITRQKYNGRIRRLKGFDDERPVMGDRLVCLKNNRQKGLINGSMWEPHSIGAWHKDQVSMTLKSLDEPMTLFSADIFVETKTPIEFFLGTEQAMDWRDKKMADEITFGWALTVHKAQGSQWGNVFVNDESHIFRENQKKWLYTAITRAADRVTILQS